MTRVLVIDNYDSFTWNLVHLLGPLATSVDVVRNDAITADEVLASPPDAIVLSPGPCTPNEAGVCLDLIAKAGSKIPILGVCLGHQAVGAAFGGRIVRAPHLMHGKTSMIHHRGKGIFAGLPDPFIATRYHSLIVDRSSLPPVFEITAESDDGTIMGLRHRELDVEGVQFHPESILTKAGRDLLGNFLGVRQAIAAEERTPVLIGY